MAQALNMPCMRQVRQQPVALRLCCAGRSSPPKVAPTPTRRRPHSGFTWPIGLGRKALRFDSRGEQPVAAALVAASFREAAIPRGEPAWE